MRVEFFRKSEADRDHWDYGRRKWPNRQGLYEMLPAPTDLDDRCKKVWTDRGYGLWPGKILREKQLIYVNVINKPEEDLLAGKIAFDLIDQDRDNFSKLSDKNHFKIAFHKLAAENEESLMRKERRLADYLAETVTPESVSDFYVSIYDAIEDCSETFIGACLRNGKGQAIHDLIIRQIEIMLIKLDDINKKLLAIHGKMNVESSAASDSR